MILGIKHIAIAVSDAEAALARYRAVLGEGTEAVLKTSDVTRQRTAVFEMGGIQYQLVESLDADGRYARHVREHGEGIHHICYAVDDLKRTVEHALTQGATLRPQTCRLSNDPDEVARWHATVDDDSVCPNCGIVGRYEHPEGWVAFLENDGVAGPGIELMQVYEPHEVPEQYRTGPLDL